MASLSLLILSAFLAPVLSVPEEELPLASSKNTMRLKVPPQLFAAVDDAHAGGGCTMEVQVTQRVVGECVKLGQFARGCVAGAYLEPYHTDCV